MGIRFHCPNGHKLNIKGFLAGKRGICPQCDSRFIIPTTSGGQAIAIEDHVESQLESIAQTQTNPAAASESIIISPPVPASAPPSAQSEQTPLPEHWYIRPAKGDVQYGPATTEMMQAWIAEERIAPDSWVWKTGWAQWKFGSEVLEELQSSTATLARTPATSNATPSINLDKQTPANSIAKKRLRNTPRGRRQRSQRITVILGAFVLLLGIAVVLVLAL